MEWFSHNWFSVVSFGVSLFITCIGLAYNYGKLNTKIEQSCKEIEKVEDELDDLSAAFTKHVSDSDIHVNKRLLDFFDERFAFIRQVLTRLENKVDKT